ncbi:hypothetical protein A374_03924 [Fictibacillus macauensis ZFHKF-1]|uniref:Uncharacterized protein n=1 Tax=Fictibacillus macauensis ZFHKF-1 TaxID=1196324 RepID=I8AM00_9BACL|nr:hypothetical protein [Fictibacillus macauensis]EIT86689.1 hypothetical protein A374_03924 [Fictibacillus macauensis ZFHKF-1]
MSWVYSGTMSGQSFHIHEIDIVKEKWIDTGVRAQVEDPLYGVIKTCPIWKVKKNNQEITFVAGEFSNNVWVIYTKQS